MSGPTRDEDRDPFEAPGAKQMAAWSLRLAQSPRFSWLLATDPHLFALLYASCAGAVAPPAALAGERLSEDAAHDQLLPTLKDLQRQFGERTSGRFARLYLRGVGLFPLAERDDASYSSVVEQWQEAAEIEASRLLTGLDRNVDRVAALLDLDPVERSLLAFQLGRRRPGFAQFYDILMNTDNSTRAVLGAALKLSPSDVASALSEGGRLVRSGILSVEERPLHVSGPSGHLQATLTDPAESDAEFVERFIKPLRPRSSTGSLGRLHDDDQRILLDVLREPMLNDRGLHALIHGPKSVDKHDMLARLLDEQGIEAFAVVTKHVPAGDMATWTYIAQHHVKQTSPDAVLVVDRAHDALICRPSSVLTLFGIDDDTIHDDPERASDEGLTSSHVRCLWVTDRARLSERNLGAFLFHCEALPGSRSERRERVAQVICDLGLSQQLEHELAKYSLLGEQQIRQAAELARLVIDARGDGDADCVAMRERVIKRAVAHSQKVLGRDRTEGLRDSVTEYRLDLLNTAGRFTPEQIIAALRKRRTGSLCFWGIPGAGKTQLAEYIAVELDVPILLRSASELLSKWLGETEQQIAAMFAEAESEGALHRVQGAPARAGVVDVLPGGGL